MGLSLARQKELANLKYSADRLWDKQRGLLDETGGLLREATRQANALAREEVAPRVAESISHARQAGTNAKDRLVSEVFPALGNTLGGALAVIGAVRDSRIRRVVRASHPSAQIVSARKTPGAGVYILAGMGVLAAVGAGYLVWRTLRDDESLWVQEGSDEDDTETEAVEGDSQRD